MTNKIRDDWQICMVTGLGSAEFERRQLVFSVLGMKHNDNNATSKRQTRWWSQEQTADDGG